VTFAVGIHFAGLTGSEIFVLSAASFVPFIANIGLFFPCLRTKTPANGASGLGEVLSWLRFWVSGGPELAVARAERWPTQDIKLAVVAPQSSGRWHNPGLLFQLLVDLDAGDGLPGLDQLLPSLGRGCNPSTR